ncbi:hypothetical protein KC340_g63 [Hortaea werneckii]|nr:hypothetical protein KC340_g63 [Hortaea werneckii]
MELVQGGQEHGQLGHLALAPQSSKQRAFPPQVAVTRMSCSMDLGASTFQDCRSGDVQSYQLAPAPAPARTHILHHGIPTTPLPSPMPYSHENTTGPTDGRRGQRESPTGDLDREDEGNVKPDPRPRSWSRRRRSGGYDAEVWRKEVSHREES